MKRTFCEPSKSAISNTFTSLWSDKSPVPKNKLDFCAAIALLSESPLQATTFTPSKYWMSISWLCPNPAV